MAIDRLHAFIESLPAMYRLIGYMAAIAALYTGLTVQNARIEERMASMNAQFAQIRVEFLSVSDRALRREADITDLRVKQAECMRDVDYLTDAIRGVKP